MRGQRRFIGGLTALLVFLGATVSLAEAQETTNDDDDHHDDHDLAATGYPALPRRSRHQQRGGRNSCCR